MCPVGILLPPTNGGRMTDEDAFLRKLLDNPADDVVRLVYADWLEERDEAAKAEFLRLEAEIATAKKARQARIKVRLQQLAATLDTSWLPIVSKIAIDRCGQVKQIRAFQIAQLIARIGSSPRPLESAEPKFEFECPRQWENLRPTANPRVRCCDGCRENVFYCDTILVARAHARKGHCVAVDLGIIRKKDDLGPPPTNQPPVMVGRLLPQQYEQRAAQIKAAQNFDPVSEKREQAKRRDDPV